MSHRTRYILICFAVAGNVACSKKPAGGAGAGFKMPPTPVETAMASRDTVRDRFETVGTIEAGEAIEVVAEIDAVVVDLPFREGAAIARGGLIAQLDDATLRAEVTRAEALLEQSRVTHERIETVVVQGAGAPQDLDDAAATLKVAAANLELARVRLEKTRIVAPFSGILGSRRVSPGAFLRAGEPITDLAQVEEIKVAFAAPERHLPRLTRGSGVSVSTTAFPGYELDGVIDVVEPVLDANLRSARVLARVRNPGGKFRPGMSANVVVVLSQRPDALTVPSEAVFVEGNQAFVYVVRADSTVGRSPVTLGTRMPNAVEILEGIDLGSQVVRAGHHKLFEGARVLPVAHVADETPATGAPGGQP